VGGQPITKARREAERKKLRATGRFTDAQKRVILTRSETVGPKLAAEEAGVSAATLRTWRRRLAQAPETTPVPPANDAGDAAPASRAAGLRAEAQAEREAASRALQTSDTMLARGAASESRNAAVVAGLRADRAAELEASARAEELHETALSRATAEAVLDLVRFVFGDVGLPVPLALFRERLASWPNPAPSDVVARGRDDVLRGVREQVRAELLAERRDDADGEDEQAEPVEQPEEIVEAEVVEDPDALPEGVELAPLAEVSDSFRTIYPDPEQARLRFTQFRHAQSPEGRAEAEAKRQAKADREAKAQAERKAAEAAKAEADRRRQQAQRRAREDREAQAGPSWSSRRSSTVKPRGEGMAGR